MVRVFVLGTCLLACVGVAVAAERETLGKLVAFEPAFHELVAEDAQIEVLSTGHDWSEGPTWMVEDGAGFVLFSDIPKNTVYKWDETEGLSVYLKPSGYTGRGQYSREPGSNGLAVDAQGRLVSCEHGDRRVSVLSQGGGKLTVADRYAGKRFNSPNDLAIKSNGDVYFTDPPYGLPRDRREALRELDFQGVYRVTPQGEVALLTKAIAAPNGIAFSQDEKVLYVAQSSGRQPVIFAFDVKADGTLGEPRELVSFASYRGEGLPGGPDGLKVDAQGNLFATGPGGVYVITPMGKVLGRIETGKRTANCAWGSIGGDGGSTLYMTADDTLCRVRTKTRGAGWRVRKGTSEVHLPAMSR